MRGTGDRRVGVVGSEYESKGDGEYVLDDGVMLVAVIVGLLLLLLVLVMGLPPSVPVV